MLQKQILLVLSCGAAAVLFFLSSGCGEQKTKSTAKTDKSGKVKTTTVATPSNVVVNPSMEEAQVFDSGLYKKDKSSIGKPAGWTTKGQVLNDSSGWVADEAHSGKHSLKIENIGGTNAYWKGKPIVLKTPVDAFKVSIWTKTKEVLNSTGKGKFQLAFVIYGKNANGREFTREIVYVDIPQKNHAWRKTSKKILVGEKISKIVPYLYFTGILGTVWFDDLDIKPYNEKGKVLFDSNANGAFTGKCKIISAKNNRKIYQISGYKKIFNSKFIPIESNKVYRLSGMFKSVTGGSEFYFGYAPYNKDKILINRSSWNYIDDTETELVKPCKFEDTVLYIKSGVNWIHGGKIAFAVDTSGKYTDLPNFNLSRYAVKKISKHNDIWGIKLFGPCKRSYPAKTKIREHIVDGQGTYMYHAANNSKIPNVWTEYSGIMQKHKNKLFGRFYPGTKYVKILIYQNSVKRKNISVDFRDIKLVEFNHKYDDTL